MSFVLLFVNQLALLVQAPAFPCFPDASHGFLAFYAYPHRHIHCARHAVRAETAFTTSLPRPYSSSPSSSPSASPATSPAIHAASPCFFFLCFLSFSFSLCWSLSFGGWPWGEAAGG